jgi:hypothetical protein
MRLPILSNSTVACEWDCKKAGDGFSYLCWNLTKDCRKVAADNGNPGTASLATLRAIGGRGKRPQKPPYWRRRLQREAALGEREASSAAQSARSPSLLKRCPPLRGNPPFTAKAPLALALAPPAGGGHRFGKRMLLSRGIAPGCPISARLPPLRAFALGRSVKPSPMNPLLPETTEQPTQAAAA